MTELNPVLDINDLVKLVDSLYSERDPTKIGSIQSYLQDIQKSSEGLHFADLLLSSPGLSLNCRFFGALTYTVNLNSQTTSLDIRPILIKLLDHLTNSINDHKFNNTQNTFIIRKLYNNISKIFNSYTIDGNVWNDPLNPIIQILLTNQPPDLTREVNYDEVIPQLMGDKTNLSLLLIFASTIIEDISKQQTQDVIKPHEVIHQRIYPLIKFIVNTIFNTNDNDNQSKIICFEHLSSWISYISHVEFSTVLRYKDINDLLKYLLDFLQSSDYGIYQASIDILTQIFENNPHLLSFELRNRFIELISSQWGSNKITQFFQDEDFDSLESFSTAIIAALDVDIIHLSILLFKDQSCPLLTLLLNLTDIPLPPILEENVSSKFIEFWTQLSELFVDEFDTIESRLKHDDVIINNIKIHSLKAFHQISSIYFKKIQLFITSNPEFKQHEIEFFSYRQDVVDLFEPIYSNIGTDLFEGLIKNVMNSSSIDEIEASLYILGGICQNLTLQGKTLDLIFLLFTSNFLEELNRLSSQKGDKAHYYLKSSIKFLGTINSFYKTQGQSYLNAVIGYLFTCLKNYPNLQAIICRTIVYICDECRLQLYQSISNFEPILVEMINNPEVDSYTREKVIHSVGCIIQSINDPTTQYNHVYTLLKLIEQASAPLLRSTNSLDEETKAYLTSLFSSIKELAKSLSFSDEFEEETPDDFKRFKQFYGNQNDIANYVLQLIALFTKCKSFVPIAVEILQVGLLESFGPFSFSSEAVVQFIFVNLSLDVSSLSNLIELTITLLNVGLKTHSEPHQLVHEEVLTSILNKVIFENMSYINQDPDLLQLSNNLFTTIVINKPAFLLHKPDVFKFIIEKTLELLRTSEERFVKKSLLKFWTSLITVKKVSSQEANAFKNFFEQEIGSLLTYSVFNGLLSSIRSDVDSYSNIIVALLSRYQLHFKTWISDTLNKIDQDRISSGLIPLPQKDFFIKQLLLTRGSTRKCNNIIKEYWASANGLMSNQKIYST